MFFIAPEPHDFHGQVRAFAQPHITPVAAGIDERAQYDVLAGLVLQRLRVKHDQQVPERQV